MRGQVLVTGFEPFGDNATNISGEVAMQLHGNIVRDCEIISMVLTVDYSGSTKIANLIKNEEFSAIVHIGLAESSVKPRIEIRAKDILDFRIPDNSGRLVSKQEISGNGDLYSTINVDDWDVESMIDSHKSVRMRVSSFVMKLYIIHLQTIQNRFHVSFYTFRNPNQMLGVWCYSVSIECYDQHVLMLEQELS